MPITQREHDIMELESKLRIAKIVDEWRRSFLATRAPQQQTEEEIDGTRGRREREENISS